MVDEGVDGVVAVEEPVAGVDIKRGPAFHFQLPNQRCVAVAEDAVVERLLQQALLAVDGNALAVVAEVAEGVLPGVLGLVAVAPAAGDGECPRRWEEGEETLVEPGAEDAPEGTVVLVEVALPVAVADEESAAVDCHHLGVGVHDGSALLLQVVEEPHVVVADEEVDDDTGIGEGGEGAEESGVATRDEVTIGKPKVEDVAEEEEHTTVALDAIEETAQLPFALEGVGAGAEVGVADKDHQTARLRVFGTARSCCLVVLTS